VATPKFCFVDVETTGTSHSKNGVIQIGGIICRNEAGALSDVEEFELNVAPYPADLIEDEALAVSGMTREQIGAFDPPAVVHTRLIAILEKHCKKFDKKDKMIFLGYNAPFDYGFLRKWFDKAGDKYFGSWFWHPPVDVMSLAALKLVGMRPDMPDFRLGTVAMKLGITVVQAHSALVDARATKEIFLKVSS
jgi:DNA polymerase III alpha subunit (gram-positive type)